MTAQTSTFDPKPNSAWHRKLNWNLFASSCLNFRWRLEPPPPPATTTAKTVLHFARICVMWWWWHPAEWMKYDENVFGCWMKDILRFGNKSIEEKMLWARCACACVFLICDDIWSPLFLLLCCGGISIFDDVITEIDVHANRSRVGLYKCVIGYFSPNTFFTEQKYKFAWTNGTIPFHSIYAWYYSIFINNNLWTISGLVAVNYAVVYL